MAIAAEPRNMTFYTNKAVVLVETQAYEGCVRLCEVLITDRHIMSTSRPQVANSYCRLAT